MKYIILFAFVVVASGCSASRVCDCAIKSNAEIDRTAYSALMSFPKSGSSEHFAIVFLDGSVSDAQVLGRAGGMAKIYGEPAAIVHTHPIVKDQPWHGDNSGKAARHDIEAAIQLGVPNYYRSHNGRSVWVIEVSDGLAKPRLVQY